MTTSEEGNDFGRYLQHHRRAKEIPLEVVSQATKIRLVLLQQLENEDLMALPPPIITKGFLRAYADAVGANKAEVLKRYETALSAHQREAQSQAAPVVTKPVWRRLLLAIILIALLIALTLFLANRSQRSSVLNTMKISKPLEIPAVTGNPPEDIKSAADAAANGGPGHPPSTAPAAISAEPEADHGAVHPPMEKVAPAASPGETSPANAGVPAQSQPSSQENLPAPAESSSTPQPPATQLVLHVTAVELTYLKIAWDAAPPTELMLRPEQQMTFEAQTGFELLIGNAAGIRLKLNDQPVPVKGPSGKVVHLKLP